MLAIPIDSKESKSVSKLFGNVEFFMLYNEETQEASVVENLGKGDGVKTGEFVASVADKTLYIHLGKGPFNQMLKSNMQIYCIESKGVSIEDAISLFKDGKFPLVTKESAKEYLDSGNPNCECTCSSS